MNASFDSSRRSFLRSGLAALGAAALLGPRRAFADVPAAGHLVVLWLNGGPSHIDTFDPKPGTKEGGPAKAIATRIPGVRISEHLPLLADRAHRLAIVRGMSTREGNHGRAQYFLHTGYAPNPTVMHPSLGGWISRAHASDGNGLPSFVSIGGPSFGGGFLGPEHGPFVLQKGGAAPPNLARSRGVDDERFARRKAMLGALEERFALETGDGKVASREALYEKAMRLMASPAAKAFDLATESDSAKAAYGDTDFGRACLVARRLLQYGVPCVEVVLDGWDTHQDNFTRTARLMSTLDAGMSALVDDLARWGLFGNTTVVCIGEFGRTPRINGNDGRDHHPAAFSAVLAGGAIRPGIVHGETNAAGAAVVKDKVSVPDLLATLAVTVGLDPNQTLMTPIGRPISLTDQGKPVTALLAPSPTA